MKRMIKTSLLAAGVAFALASMSVVAQPGDGSADPRKMDSNRLAVVGWNPPVVASTLKPIVWMDKASLLYQLGESAQAFVRVNEDAYISVISIEPDGQTTLLFPNQYSPDNRVRANATLELGTQRSGFGLLVEPNEALGGNVLKVIASKQPIDWVAGMKTARNGAFTTVNEAGTQLAQRLSVVANQQPGAQVAVTQVVFGVVQPGYAITQQVAPPVPAFVVSPPPAPQQPLPPNPLPPNPLPPPVPVPPPAVSAAYPIPSAHSDFGLQLSAIKPQYAPGEKIELVITPERKCSLVMLDVAPDGTYNVLFPNAVDKEVWLDARKATFLSGGESKGKIEAAGSGAHTLLALCTANRTFSQWFFGKTEYRTDATSRSQVVVKQPTLEEVMSERPKGDAANASVVYTVIGQ